MGNSDSYVQPMNNKPISADVVQTGAFDGSNVMQLSETKDVINEIVNMLCGVKVIEENNKKTMKRDMQPVFTYDYSNMIATNVYLIGNRLTGRSTMKEEQINRYLALSARSLMMSMATTGMKNLISTNMWMKILEFQSQGVWKKKGITWDYNSTVNSDMVEMVKKVHPELRDESFNQSIILNQLFWSLMELIHFNMNRSKDALTLNHEKVIYKESQVNNYDPNKKSDEGRLEGFKQFFRGMTGSKQ